VGAAITQRSVRYTTPRQSIVDEIAAERRQSKRKVLADTEQARDTTVIQVEDRVLNTSTSTVPPPTFVAPTLPRNVTEDDDDDSQEHHWTYGTALADLTCTRSKCVVAKKGERLLFVYPMQNDPDQSDAVLMRLKKVNSTTAQLSYHWVCIYSGVQDDLYFVNNFSTIQ
jgi:hypothetical protein